MKDEQIEFIENISYNVNPGADLYFDIQADDSSIELSIEPNNGIISLLNNKAHYVSELNFNGIDNFSICFKRDGKFVELFVRVKVGYSFKAKSHILSLLGDELIGSDNLAIFELVKNAYDADAEKVTITFKDLNTAQQAIIVEDDGVGMSLDTLTNVWLEIGTDFKRGQNRKPSKIFNRVSLGEKGVGRLAIHKLGRSIKLETKQESSEIAHRLTLNWQKLVADSEYINETSVEIKAIDNPSFPKKKGTRLIIEDLKKNNWTRGELRDLARKVLSIKSPFKMVKGTFDVIIDAGKQNDWISDIKDIDTLLGDAIYKFNFKLDKGKFSEFAVITWEYDFSPPKSFKIDNTKLLYPMIGNINQQGSDFNCVFDIKTEKSGDPFFKEGQKHLLNADLEGIGEISGRFYVYNLHSVVLRSFGQIEAIKTFVRENCGVKIFRDGIRVYNYGEQNDDWLGLDLSRVQRLGNHFSKNVTIGAIEITQEGSFQNLKEKTNREGFDENYTYLKFKNICSQIFKQFESVAQKDRDILRDHVDGFNKPKVKESLPDTIQEIFDKLKIIENGDKVFPLLRKVERDYNDMRDLMLNSGMTGVNLGIVFHEVEREVKYINVDLKKNNDVEIIKERVNNLITLLDGFSPILKQNKNSTLKASDLVLKAKNINLARFTYHKIIFSSPLISGENQDFNISGPLNLLISAISNLIDNSIYWVTNRDELEGDTFKGGIMIGSNLTDFDGPTILIADNGSGFRLDPEDLVKPYRTTRPGGMGLGLYFVNLVMNIIGGKLIFPDQSDINIPKIYDGALVALVFPKK